MDIQHLMTLVDAKINDDARRSGVMTLRELRSGLATLPPETSVVFDRGGAPGNVDSYRGYYERLAFETIFDPITVSQVLAVLDEADGETFQGYKGGDFTMGGHTFLHVAEWSHCGPQIVGMRDEGGRVVIETREEEF